MAIVLRFYVLQTTEEGTTPVKFNMKPTPQFQMMIAGLLENRQTAITSSDLSKHRENETAFYAVNKIVIKNNSIVSQSQPFSDQTIIEITKGANLLSIVESETRSINYKRTTALEMTVVQGKHLLHWGVENSSGIPLTVVKLMSPDGFVLIKLISNDQSTQTVYSVCELPMHMISK